MSGGWSGREARRAPTPRRSAATPAQVARRFRALLEAGAELRPAGSARFQPEVLLTPGYLPRHEVALFDATFFLTDLLFDEALGFFVAYVVLGQAVIASFCWMQGVRIVGANRAAITYNLVPVFTALFALIFLGETLEPYHGVGFMLIFAGMCLALFGPDRAVAIEAPAP